MPWIIQRTDELYHHGVKGMKWYHRRWQNPDGSLTPAGREHYGYSLKEQRQIYNRMTSHKPGKMTKINGEDFRKVSKDKINKTKELQEKITEQTHKDWRAVEKAVSDKVNKASIEELSEMMANFLLTDNYDIDPSMSEKQAKQLSKDIILDILVESGDVGLDLKRIGLGDLEYAQDPDGYSKKTRELRDEHHTAISDIANDMIGNYRQLYAGDNARNNDWKVENYIRRYIDLLIDIDNWP